MLLLSIFHAAKVRLFRLSGNPHLLGINGAPPFDGPPPLPSNNLFDAASAAWRKDEEDIIRLLIFLTYLKVKGQAP